MQEEVVYLCRTCQSETEEGSNDWGSFHYCPKCDKSDFINNIKKEKNVIVIIGDAIALMGLRFVYQK